MPAPARPARSGRRRTRRWCPGARRPDAPGDRREAGQHRCRYPGGRCGAGCLRHPVGGADPSAAGRGRRHQRDRAAVGAGGGLPLGHGRPAVRPGAAPTRRRRVVGGGRCAAAGSGVCRRTGAGPVGQRRRPRRGGSDPGPGTAGCHRRGGAGHRPAGPARTRPSTLARGHVVQWSRTGPGLESVGRQPVGSGPLDPGPVGCDPVVEPHPGTRAGAADYRRRRRAAAHHRRIPGADPLAGTTGQPVDAPDPDRSAPSPAGGLLGGILGP